MGIKNIQGNLNINGNLVLNGDLTVAGTNLIQNTETLSVKDNIIVTNADGNILIENAGFAMKTSATAAYGIMYDPVGDGVKIGLGAIDKSGKFNYTEGEDQFLATRADNITDGNLPQWDNDKKQFVDSGAKIADYVKFTDYATVNKAGVVKINDFLGIRIDAYGAIYLDTANDSEIAEQKGNAAIKVYQTPQAVKSGLLKHDNVDWTDEDKAKACETIGAVAKQANTRNNPQVYVQNANGEQVMVNLSNVREGNAIVRYSADGRIDTDTPNTDYHAANKKYVDELAVGILTEEQIDLLF